jgi:hypothetical protein
MKWLLLVGGAMAPVSMDDALDDTRRSAAHHISTMGLNMIRRDVRAMAHDAVHSKPSGLAPPGTLVKVVGALVALWCAGFAFISFWFEVTDRFASGPHAADAAALSVVNWYVFALKLVGVVAAVLATTRPPRFLGAPLIGVLLWAAFATVTIYVLGSLTQAVVMMAGIAGDARRIDAASVGYVFAFLLATAGFGVLAISYARRASLGKRELIMGICGAPLVLGSILVVLPALLKAAGVLEP